MFYLMHFFQIIKQYPIRGMLFFVLSTLLFFTAGHREQISKRLGETVQTQIFNPFFHALIPEKHNTSWMARKLRELPGVARVEILQKEAVNKEVKEILSGMDGEVLNAIGEMNFVGMKVVTKNQLEERSITLVKEYLNRLANNSATIGATVLPPEKKKSSGFVWQEWSAEIVLGLVFFAWIASVFSLVTPLRRSSYLTEQFQRRRGVAMKTWLSATLLAVIFGTTAAFVWRPPELIPVLVCLAAALTPSALYSKRVSWKG